MLSALLLVALTSGISVPSSASGSRLLSAAALSGDITGLVRDSTSGQPLVGTEVIVFRGAETVARVQTDALGRYRIHNLPDGEYDVEMRMVGFSPARSHVSVSGGGGTAVSLNLSPPRPRPHGS